HPIAGPSKLVVRSIPVTDLSVFKSSHQITDSSTGAHLPDVSVNMFPVQVAYVF
ncbi:unnamed protein product, partial [Rhizoctonia solani]